MSKNKLDKILIDGIDGTVDESIRLIKRNRKYIQKTMNSMKQETFSKFGVATVSIIMDGDNPIGLNLVMEDGTSNMFVGEEAEEWIKKLT